MTFTIHTIYSHNYHIVSLFPNFYIFVEYSAYLTWMIRLIYSFLLAKVQEGQETTEKKKDFSRLR